MSLSLIFLMSLVAVAAALVTLIRIMGLRRVLRHATLIDICFTLIVCFALAGTLTGLLIGILAGLVMTGVLTVARWVARQIDAGRAVVARPVQETEDWCPGGTAGRL